jgi:xylulokinase
VIDSLGKVIDSARYEYPIISEQYGWAEQNPEDWYQAFKSGFKDILERNPDIYKDIAAIGLTGQMISLTLLDRDCNVIHPAILWMDQRCLPQVNYLNKNYKKLINEITFNPAGIQYTLPKILCDK